MHQARYVNMEINVNIDILIKDNMMNKLIKLKVILLNKIINTMIINLKNLKSNPRNLKIKLNIKLSS
jgi:hypothetical protein